MLRAHKNVYMVRDISAKDFSKLLLAVKVFLNIHSYSAKSRTKVPEEESWPTTVNGLIL